MRPLKRGSAVAAGALAGVILLLAGGLLVEGFYVSITALLGG